MIGRLIFGVLRVAAPLLAVPTSAIAVLLQLPSSNVVIANSGNKTVAFQIRPADGQWTDQQLESGANLTYQCQGCVAFEVRLVTDEKHAVTKVLQGKRRYRIFWNSSSGIWARRPQR